MLSDSRLRESISAFTEVMMQISTQIINYYFHNQKSTEEPYKMRKPNLELYFFVYQRCTSKPAREQKMLQIYKSVLHKHVSRHLDYLHASIGQVQQFQVYNKVWESYTAFLNLLSKRIFVYLNRFYLPANGQDTLQKIGLHVFVVTSLTENFMRLFVTSYSSAIHDIRISRIINSRQLYKFSVTMRILDTQKLYFIVKKVFMSQTQKYYFDIFKEKYGDQPISYLNFINNLKYFQKTLIAHTICFNDDDHKQLEDLFNQIMVKMYTQTLCQHPYGLKYFLRRFKNEDLKTVCQIYQQKQGFETMKLTIGDFIFQQGNVRLTDKSKIATSQLFLSSFYQFYSQYSKLLSGSFPKVIEIQNSFKSAIEKLLMKFDRITDDLFRVTRNHLDLGTFDQVSDIIIETFQKLPYKDEFLNLYKLSLEKKIIEGNLIFLIQKKFIQTIHKICGNEQTTDLDKILEDYINSMPKNLSLMSNNFSPKIVSYHLWHKKFQDQLSLNLTLVEPLLGTWRKFQQFYSQSFPKRVLLLMPFQTKILLKVLNQNRQILIKCNLVQACIILFIANTNKQCEKEENLINELTLQKSFIHRFLEQNPNLILQSLDGYLTFNWKFEATDLSIDLDSRVQQQKKVTRHVKQDRQILLQFAIVKVIKKKKEIVFQDLCLEVNKNIKLFKPHPSGIKTELQVLKKKQIIQQLEDGRLIYKQ